MKSTAKNKILDLYPGYHTIYGPYLRKDGRKIVILYNGVKRSARQLARVKMEVKLKRRLTAAETVDHKDGNVKNDKFSNLQILTLAENVSKSSTGNTYRLGIKQSEEHKRNGEKNGLAKTTNALVYKARVLYEKGKIGKKQIMDKTGLSDRSVRNMLRGISYVNAGGPLVTGSGRIKFR